MTRRDIGILTICLSALFILCFLAIPQTSLTTLLGIHTGQSRLIAFGKAAIWGSKSIFRSTQAVSSPEAMFGNLKTFNDNGELKVIVASGSKFVVKELPLSNVRLIDISKARNLVEKYQSDDVKIEMYPDTSAVIWISEQSLNVQLIEAGFAIPVLNPQSTIADIAFASYYWRIFKGN